MVSNVTQRKTWDTTRKNALLGASLAPTGLVAIGCILSNAHI